MDNEDLLSYALENGIIDIAYIQDRINMNKQKEYLEKHSYSVWEGKDQYWRTYLPDDVKGRRLIKRKTKESVEKTIITFYREVEEKTQLDFKTMYFKWRKVKDQLVSGNTCCKYNSEYIRFFENTEFERIAVADITEETIKVFLCNTIKEKKLSKKATKSLFGYVNNVIRSARINKIIDDNPMRFLEANQFYTYCTETKKPIEKKIVSDKEMKMLYERFQKDYAKQPEYIPTYAVEFATLTGFRVAEISALTWECITDDYILVNKSEKYNRLTKTYYVGKTKNGEERVFPKTKEIRFLLDKVKKVSIKYGYFCEWVFANENGRIHAPVISSCTKNKCRQLGITEKGIHAYRKTVNSKLRCNGVPAVVASSLLGHSKQVNEQYYTFDITSIEDKVNIMSKVNCQMQNTK